jgi:hypothetical protein
MASFSFSNTDTNDWAVDWFHVLNRAKQVYGPSLESDSVDQSQIYYISTRNS